MHDTLVEIVPELFMENSFNPSVVIFFYISYPRPLDASDVSVAFELERLLNVTRCERQKGQR